MLLFANLSGSHSKNFESFATPMTIDTHWIEVKWNVLIHLKDLLISRKFRHSTKVTLDFRFYQNPNIFIDIFRKAAPVPVRTSADWVVPDNQF